MKKILVMLGLCFLIVSCGGNTNDSGGKNQTSQSGNTEKSEEVIEKMDIEELDVQLDENRVGSTLVRSKNTQDEKQKVPIKKGRAQDFEPEFWVIPGGVIYQNARVNQYAFLLINKKSVEEVYDYYKKDLEAKGWKWNVDEQWDGQKNRMYFEKENTSLQVDIKNETPSAIEKLFWKADVFLEARTEVIEMEDIAEEEQ